MVAELRRFITELRMHIEKDRPLMGSGFALPSIELVSMAVAHISILGFSTYGFILLSKTWFLT